MTGMRRKLGLTSEQIDDACLMQALLSADAGTCG